MHQVVTYQPLVTVACEHNKRVLGDRNSANRRAFRNRPEAHTYCASRFGRERLAARAGCPRGECEFFGDAEDWERKRRGPDILQRYGFCRTRRSRLLISEVKN